MALLTFEKTNNLANKMGYSTALTERHVGREMSHQRGFQLFAHETGGISECAETFRAGFLQQTEQQLFGDTKVIGYKASGPLSRCTALGAF
jgi:hypothetical protein